MSKLLVIPDIHGRTFWRCALNHVDKYEKIIFLGDYLDPYSHENISFNTAVENFKEILKFKSENLDKVILLLGNHDMHYYDLDFMDCSRLDYVRREEMHRLYLEHDTYFRLAYLFDNYFLFSHAGIYEKWLNKYHLTIEDILNDKVSYRALEDVSAYRGGWEDVGSCIWADIRESLEYPIDTKYYQIIGHTQIGNSPYITNEIACLDVKKCFELDTQTKKIIGINRKTNLNESSNN